ncbi:MAG: SsrA-binding protein SmpB [Phycisphaerales bacterium]|nr:SsrA-binding protein SmpB [Phycisphaerales bacterium]
MAADRKDKDKSKEPVIENRRARHDYHIDDTVECGLKLTGTEIKSLRAGQVSLGEGYVKASDAPLGLTLHSVHIAEYPPAGESRQHKPIRERILLAHAREIKRLAEHVRAKGLTLVPLKIYFVRGRAKLLVGLARGKRQHDKRADIAAREAKREMDRQMRRR